MILLWEYRINQKNACNFLYTKKTQCLGIIYVKNSDEAILVITWHHDDWIHLFLFSEPIFSVHGYYETIILLKIFRRWTLGSFLLQDQTQFNWRNIIHFKFLLKEWKALGIEIHFQELKPKEAKNVFIFSS